MEKNQLIVALAKAKLEFPEIKKSRTANVGKYGYNYADLSDILAAVNPVLSKYELVLYFSATPEKNPLGETMTAYLEHSSGGKISSSGFIPDCETAQQLGSWKTYMKRYLACEVLGIQAEDDDDGQAAQKTPPRVETRPVQSAIKPTAPVTSSGIKLPVVPKLSADEFILSGKLAGKRIDELGIAALQDWEKNAAEHLMKSGLDPETSTTDMARHLRAVRKQIATLQPSMFDTFDKEEHDVP